MITIILFGLLYFALAILVLYLVIWILGLLSVAVPDQIKKILIAIIALLIIIWIISGNVYIPNFRR
jgi:hypothetical protein